MKKLYRNTSFAIDGVGETPNEARQDARRNAQDILDRENIGTKGDTLFQKQRMVRVRPDYELSWFDDIDPVVLQPAFLLGGLYLHEHPVDTADELRTACAYVSHSMDTLIVEITSFITSATVVEADPGVVRHEIKRFTGRVYRDETVREMMLRAELLDLHKKLIVPYIASLLPLAPSDYDH